MNPKNPFERENRGFEKFLDALDELADRVPDDISSLNIGELFQYRITKTQGKAKVHFIESFIWHCLK